MLSCFTAGIADVITTQDGKKKIFTGLFGGKNRHYYQYLKEYGIELTDIESESDNEQLLKKCMDLAFYFTKDPETAANFRKRRAWRRLNPKLIFEVLLPKFYS